MLSQRMSAYVSEPSPYLPTSKSLSDIKRFATTIAATEHATAATELQQSANSSEQVQTRLESVATLQQ